MTSRVVKIEPGTGAAQANASQPTMDHQMQQRNYAFENQTRGAAQLRSGDPMDFGMVAYHKDPMDEQIQIRKELMGTAPPVEYDDGTNSYRLGPSTTQAGELLGIPSAQIQRTMPITDAEIAYAQRWQAQQQQLLRDQAIATMFDLSNPAERDRVMRLFPGYMARQRAFVDSKFAVMRKYVDISMTGIQSEEDAEFVYNVRAGLIQLPRGYANFDQLTEPMDPLTGKAGGPAAPGTLVARGPFNLYKYFSTQQVADIAGYTDANKAYAFLPHDAGQAKFNAANFWGTGMGKSGPPDAVVNAPEKKWPNTR
jgi:hypothetical protein